MEEAEFCSILPDGSSWSYSIFLKIHIAACCLVVIIYGWVLIATYYLGGDAYFSPM